LPVLVFLPLLLSCELTEVTVAPGQRVVVVQSVINLSPSLVLVEPGPEEFVVVEYSQTGATEATSNDLVPPGDPAQPISGALVTIEHLDSPPCAGRVDTLVELPSHQVGERGSGTYHFYLGCLPQGGDHLRLRVETPAGEVVTGTLTVPRAAARDATPEYYPGILGPLDREHDTLRIGVTPISGRALQVEVRNHYSPDQLAFFALTDTMGMTIPGNLVNPFEGDSGESIFHAGRSYDLAVALADTNYYDFLRSRSDPFTGRGFINHLVGGIGVFGAVESVEYPFDVVAPVDDPREGEYQMEGMIDTGPLTLTLSLYLDEVERNQFSAFVWYTAPDRSYRTNGDGLFWPDGSGRMDFHFRGPGASAQTDTTYQLTSVRRPGGAPFPVILTTFVPGQATHSDTLTARQISGPGSSPQRSAAR
jgi:hypothetical protein